MAKPSKTPVVFAPWEDETQKPIIQFKNVTKRFGNFTAIDNLSLDIFEREFFALLGPSGCGKTTIMRMLAGFEAVTEGTILLGGKDISPVPPNKRPVNMMFQSYALFPHLSVWDNIAFGLRRSSMPKDEIGARVDEMLRLTRMEKFAKRKPHQISGGQRQRVALARSLAKAPKLLLLDEPLGAPELQRQRRGRRRDGENPLLQHVNRRVRVKGASPRRADQGDMRREVPRHLGIDRHLLRVDPLGQRALELDRDEDPSYGHVSETPTRVPPSGAGVTIGVTTADPRR